MTSAGARSHGSIAPSAIRIAESAAEVMETEGLGGLTHRAVATRAGMTTGAVTHHFRTIEDLVAGAIRGQVQAMNRDLPGAGPASTIDEIQTVKQLFDALRQHALADRPTGPALRRRLLFLAAVRRTDLASSSAVIRYSYGGTVRNALGRIFQLTPDTLALNAGVLARLVATVWYACSADPSPREARKILITEILARFSRYMDAGEQTA
jgi:AcrR family transcriptional regulator